MRKVSHIEKGYEIPYIIALGYSLKANEQYEVPERKAVAQVMMQL